MRTSAREHGWVTKVMCGFCGRNLPSSLILRDRETKLLMCTKCSRCLKPRQPDIRPRIKPERPPFIQPGQDSQDEE